MSINSTTAMMCALVVVLWGLWGFFGKLALEHSMPPQFIFLVEAAVGLLMALGFVLTASVLPSSARASWSIFGVLSGAALAVGILIYYMALQREGASVVVVATSTYPLITVFLSFVVLREKLVPLQYTGVALIVV